MDIYHVGSLFVPSGAMSVYCALPQCIFRQFFSGNLYTISLPVMSLKFHHDFHLLAFDSTVHSSFLARLPGGTLKDWGQSGFEIATGGMDEEFGRFRETSENHPHRKASKL